MPTARIAAESMHFKESIEGAIKLIKAHLESIIHDYRDYLPAGKRGRPLKAFDEYRNSLQLVDDYLNDLGDELTHEAAVRIEDAYQAGVSEDEILAEYDLVDSEITYQREADPSSLSLVSER